MSFVFNRAKTAQLGAGLRFTTADYRIELVMSSTTAGSERDAASFDDFTTLDPFNGTINGAAYTAAVLTSKAVLERDSAASPFPNQSAIDAADTEFLLVAGGARPIVAGILYEHTGDLATQKFPVAYIDGGGLPVTLNGAKLTFEWNLYGILRLRDG